MVPLFPRRRGYRGRPGGVLRTFSTQAGCERGLRRASENRLGPGWLARYVFRNPHFVRPRNERADRNLA